jgi:hypothetical protein
MKYNIKCRVKPCNTATLVIWPSKTFFHFVPDQFLPNPLDSTQCLEGVMVDVQ